MACFDRNVPGLSARRQTSANSGLMFMGRFCQELIFTRTSGPPPGWSAFRAAGSPVLRGAGAARWPCFPGKWPRSLFRAPLSAHRTVSWKPGRPFFIRPLAIKISTAPAWMIFSPAAATISPLLSSRLNSSTQMRSLAGQASLSPTGWRAGCWEPGRKFCGRRRSRFSALDRMPAVGLAAASGQDGGGGRGQQFVFDVAAAVFQALDQVQHRRRRHRQQPVPGLDVAPAGDQGGEKTAGSSPAFPTASRSPGCRPANRRRRFRAGGRFSALRRGLRLRPRRCA